MAQPKKTGLGKGLDALFSDKTVIEDIKKEEVKDVDYSKMTVAELKEVAKEKNINVTGMKKAEIVAELSK